MSIVIGLECDNKVIMGSDSIGVKDWTYEASIESGCKMFKKGEFLIGAVGSFRESQIMQYSFNVPTPRQDETDDIYIHTTFINGIRDALRAGDALSINNGVARKSGQLLIGWRGKLYITDIDLQIRRAPNGIYAIGAGYMVGLGAMLALDGVEPRERIMKSLMITERVSHLTRGPFVIMESD